LFVVSVLPLRHRFKIANPFPPSQTIRITTHTTRDKLRLLKRRRVARLTAAAAKARGASTQKAGTKASFSSSSSLCVFKIT
jgi:aspartyl/asparaginyl beta-hydroxylase (cupin superfamily)